MIMERIFKQKRFQLLFYLLIIGKFKIRIAIPSLRILWIFWTPSRWCNHISFHLSVQLDREKQSASVFLRIVVAYFISFLPTNILFIYDVIGIENYLFCTERGQTSFPVWQMIFQHLSVFSVHLFTALHLLLMILSSSGYQHQCRDCVRCQGGVNWCCIFTIIRFNQGFHIDSVHWIE